MLNFSRLAAQVVTIILFIGSTVQASYLVRTPEMLSGAEFMRAYEIISQHQFPSCLTYTSTGELDLSQARFYHVSSAEEKSAIEQELHAAGINAQLTFIPESLYSYLVLAVITKLHSRFGECTQAARDWLPQLASAFYTENPSLNDQQKQMLQDLGSPESVASFFYHFLDNIHCMSPQFEEIGRRICAFWAHADFYYGRNTERIASSIRMYDDLYRAMPIAYYINACCNVLLNRMSVPLDTPEIQICAVLINCLKKSDEAVIKRFNLVPDYCSEQMNGQQFDFEMVRTLVSGELQAQRKNKIILYRDENYTRSVNENGDRKPEDDYLRFLGPLYSRSYSCGFFQGLISDGDRELGSCIATRLLLSPRNDGQRDVFCRDLVKLVFSRTEYLESLHKILFIPPLNSIHGLLGSGEYWHPRTRLIGYSKFTGGSSTSCPEEIDESLNFQGIQDPSDDIARFLLEKTGTIEELNRLEQSLNRAHY